MLTETDEFVIALALENQLLTAESAEELRAVCRNNTEARALDLMRENHLVSQEYLEAIEKEVASHFKKSVTNVPSGDVRFKHMDELLRIARDMAASDLHVGAGYPPVVRVHGRLVGFQTPPLSAEEAERLTMGILKERQKNEVLERWQSDFAYDLHGIGRFRGSVVKKRLGYDAVFRVVSNTVPTMEELRLPEDMKRWTEFHQGLVLVTGPVGSGKSTTMAAFLEEINRRRRDHIITLEDPIEYVFEPKLCQITQREIPGHSRSFSAALRAALREDPDVIMVGEMRDLETISLAITAAETGHLVFGTLHTNNAARTIDRVLDVFPADQQGQIRVMLSESLKGIISQQLVPIINGGGRAMALEILSNNPAVAACIRDNKTFLLPGIMQTGKKLGMKLMDDSLMELLKSNTISGREAYERAEIKGPFALFAEQEN